MKLGRTIIPPVADTGRWSPPWRAVAAAGVTVAVTVGLGLAGCSGDPSSAVVVLGVVADADEDGSGTSEYRFELPDQVRSGPTRVSLTNHDDEPHHAQLFKLNDGATVSDLAAALSTRNPAAALEFGTFEGGTALVAPGEISRADAVVELTEGDYVFICFVEDSDGVAHLAHGMLHPFAVTDAGSPSSPPDADIIVELIDYGFDLPETIRGDALLTITNAATEPHEMIVARLDEGATAAHVLDALDHGRPPPATAVGGMQAIFAGHSQLLQLALQPGHYVVVCEIPSPDGTPHHAKGMIKEVTVT